MRRTPASKLRAPATSTLMQPASSEKGAGGGGAQIKKPPVGVRPHGHTAQGRSPPGRSSNGHGALEGLF